MVKLEVAQYSVFCRPQEYYHDLQEARSYEIPNALINQISTELDLICFSQAYDYTSRNILVEQAAKQGFNFYTKLIGEDQEEFTYDCCSTKLKRTNGGVFVISKHKIIKTEVLLLDETPIANSKINSLTGFLHIKIKKEDTLFNIFVGEIENDTEVHKLKKFIDSQKIDKSEVVLIIGSFNIDMYKDLKNFKKLTKNLKAITPTKVPESMDSTYVNYNSMVKSKVENTWKNYILVSIEHMVPSAAKMSAVRVTPEIPLCLKKGSCFSKTKLAVDLSDHFPVYFQGFWV